MSKTSLLILALVAASMPSTSARLFGFLRQQDCNGQCPNVSPLGDDSFNLDSFIEKSWFIQKQQLTPYQQENQFYCVVATYEKSTDFAGFIDVKNYGNNDAVNGAIQNSDDPNNSVFARLCAKQLGAGELQVAPCCFSGSFGTSAGPYWVVALDPAYQWAIISGGQPDQLRTNDAGTTVCTTKSDCTNGSGLWLFTRDKVATAATLATMDAKLAELGIYSGDLKTVTQEGCNYDGATLKQ